MKPRHFLSFADWSTKELDALLVLAERMRRGEYRERPLEGKTLAMVFTKASTRTRVSFEVGTLQLGGHPLFLSSRDVQLGRGEPIADTARVLSRYVDGILVRMYAQRDVDELARYATVPVINGLTDWLHPCQVLADLLTIRQHLGSVKGMRIAWIGDGNNMCNSWIEGAERFGFTLAIACPKGYEPDMSLVRRARKKTTIEITNDPRAAAARANVVNTDVWASMGQEEEQAARERAFAPFRVDAQVMKRADKGAIFLHCLPAHRGEEVTASVIDGRQSRVWDQAENRLHVQKAIMATIMKGRRASGLEGRRGRRG
ncbi:MAG TPA: ornithine carbamoyltransferase [Gemmatimonadaceae bacterium]|nr:ornithine carbamoyltransferase [Gemmatimonadaceae bacterium]